MSGVRRFQLAGEVPIGADIVVVGAGIVGCTVAAALAEAGADVLLVERRAPDAGAAPAVAVRIADKSPGALLTLALANAAAWRQIATACGDEQLGAPLGGLVVAATPGELAALEGRAAAQARAGLAVRLVSADELGGIEPGLAPGLAGGLFCAAEAVLDPRRAVTVALGRLRAAHGLLATGVEVTGAALDHGGDVRRLRTSAGWLVVGSAVVDAAGAWSGELGQRLGAVVPVQPWRDHVLVSEPAGPLVHHGVADAATLEFGGPDAPPGTLSASIVPASGGELVLGSARERAGFSPRPTPALVAALARRSAALVPGLGELRLRTSAVSLRPRTPDGLPLLGRSAVIGGLLHATGHGDGGGALAAVAGEALCALSFGTPVPLALEPFAPGRFDRPGAA